MTNKKTIKKAERIARWIILPIPMLLTLIQCISFLFMVIGMSLWAIIKVPGHWWKMIVSTLKMINEGENGNK